MPTTNGRAATVLVSISVAGAILGWIAATEVTKLTVLLKVSIIFLPLPFITLDSHLTLHGLST